MATADVDRDAKITVNLGDRALLRALKIAAVEEDMTVREIVIESVTYWLNHRELIENDLANAKADRVEATSSGTHISHEELKAKST